MPRQTKRELDDEIIETAAALFARHGFKQTSIQRIADAVGYSKAGLLHRYPSKETLQEAVIGRCLTRIQAVADTVATLDPGPARDREAMIAVARLAVRHPGLVALLLSLLSSLEPDEVPVRMEAIGRAVFDAFAVDPAAEPNRFLRVVGALGALAVARLSLYGQVPSNLAEVLAAIGCDALGTTHPSSGDTGRSA